MCSNQVVENLECYMEDLVECFEDFVRKSLLVISFGVGLIVAMLIYLLKVVYDRPPIQNIVAENAVSAQNQIRNMVSPCDTCVEEENTCNELAQKKKSVCCEETRSELITTGVNTAPRMHVMSSYDEQVLRDIGFSSCFKPGCRRRINDNSNIPSRVPIPSLTTSPPKYKSIHSMRLSKPNISSLQLCSRLDQESCCSICCDDTLN